VQADFHLEKLILMLPHSNTAEAERRMNRLVKRCLQPRRLLLCWDVGVVAAMASPADNNTEDTWGILADPELAGFFSRVTYLDVPYVSESLAVSVN
jgi:hypothetical protein